MSKFQSNRSARIACGLLAGTALVSCQGAMAREVLPDEGDVRALADCTGAYCNGRLALHNSNAQNLAASYKKAFCTPKPSGSATVWSCTKPTNCDEGQYWAPNCKNGSCDWDPKDGKCESCEAGKSAPWMSKEHSKLDIDLPTILGHMVPPARICTQNVHVFTEEDAKALAKRLKFRIGCEGKCKYPFKGNYGTKGLYGYMSGPYAGMAFFGEHGSEDEMQTTLTYPQTRLPFDHPTESLKAAEIALSLGLELGGPRASDGKEYPFVSNDYSIKGLYAYKSGEYAGRAFFGVGDSPIEPIIDSTGKWVHTDEFDFQTTLINENKGSWVNVYRPFIKTDSSDDYNHSSQLARCGPDFGHRKCDSSIYSWAKYCNYSGWCGSSSDGHWKRRFETLLAEAEAAPTDYYYTHFKTQKTKFRESVYNKDGKYALFTDYDSLEVANDPSKNDDLIKDQKTSENVHIKRYNDGKDSKGVIFDAKAGVFGWSFSGIFKSELAETIKNEINQRVSTDRRQLQESGAAEPKKTRRFFTPEK